MKKNKTPVDAIYIKEKLTSKILEVMEKKKLSQVKVADLVGLDVRNLNKVLRGTERGISIEQLIRVANSISLEVDITIRKKQTKITNNKTKG